MDATGQGIKESDGIESFEEVVVRYCKYYFLLLPVMVDMCSSRPLANSEYLYYPSEAGIINETEASDDSFSSGNDFEENSTSTRNGVNKFTEPPPKKRKETIHLNITLSKPDNMCEYLENETIALLDGGNVLNTRNRKRQKDTISLLKKIYSYRNRKRSISIK